MINEEIIKQFNIPGNLIEIKQKTNGNINKTYIATYEEEGITSKYLIQQINNYVFKNPYDVMNNIEGITRHLQKELDKLKDKEHKVLKVIKTIDNKNMVVHKNEEGKEEFYRVYNFIDNTLCFDNTEDSEVVRNVGKAFGNFQKLLNDYPIETLAETIIDFHHTKNRFTNFEKDVENNLANRVKLVDKEIKFVLQRKNICSLIVDKLENKEIPYRVTHNDTKVNNVLMNEQTKDFFAVIDLDTVMPGSMLYDYGDGIRSTASNASEDETDLNKVFIRNELFENYTDGFLSELSQHITEEEVKLMGQSILLMTFELAIRFLDDYINGDKYFKCNYETHNLDRARNQIKLVEDIENKMDYINSYIWENYKRYCK